MYLFFFFFNDTATTEIYTLSLHDALPISQRAALLRSIGTAPRTAPRGLRTRCHGDYRSEEHTSELQSQSNLVCRLLLEKKKKRNHLSFTPLTTSLPIKHCTTERRPSITVT